MEYNKSIKELVKEFPYPQLVNTIETLYTFELYKPLEIKILDDSVAVVYSNNTEYLDAPEIPVMILSKEPIDENYKGKLRLNRKLETQYGCLLSEYHKLDDLETINNMFQEDFIQVIYDKDTLNLQGKKYSNIRNRKNYFEKQLLTKEIEINNTKLTDLSEDELDEIFQFKREWIKQYDDRQRAGQVDNGNLYLESIENLINESLLSQLYVYPFLLTLPIETYVHRVRNNKGVLLATSITTRFTEKFVYTPDRVVIDFSNNDLPTFLQLKEIEFWENLYPEQDLHYLSGAVQSGTSLLKVKTKIPFKWVEV